MAAITYREYKAAREWAKGRPLTARQALDHIRWLGKTAEKLPDLEWAYNSRDGASTYTYTQDGWEITIKVALDDYDFDWHKHGEWTDTWKPGCLVNPHNSRESRYYRHPHYDSGARYSYHYSENCAGIAEYAHKAGASRHEAWLQEQAARRQDMEWDSADSNLEYYTVSAKASMLGVTLGYASVGGVDVTGGLSDPYIRETAAEIAEEAMDTGKAKLQQLLEAAS